MIPVTKSFIPPIEEFNLYLKQAISKGWLTNRGNLVKTLEKNITSYLALDESKTICMSNGTIPLQIALKKLGGYGEIITTPFSYVATTSSIVWESCTPVFVDIEEDYLTIDASKIESAITEKTTCILATHVFGNACDIHEIERIAEKYNLKVIYDAAHCFGVKYKGKSIFEYGDVSTCSFHATKLFQTGEGGAVFLKDSELYDDFMSMHTFGHKYPYDFHGIGINGKMSELHAAMGLAVLPYMSEIINKRKEVFKYYENYLPEKIKLIKIRPDVTWNYSYVPILFQSEINIDKAVMALEKENIFPRKYFYPTLDRLPYIKKRENCKLDNAHSIASRILCLPTYVELRESEIIKICNVIEKSQKE